VTPSPNGGPDQAPAAGSRRWTAVVGVVAGSLVVAVALVAGVASRLPAGQRRIHDDIRKIAAAVIFAASILRSRWERSPALASIAQACIGRRQASW